MTAVSLLQGRQAHWSRKEITIGCSQVAGGMWYPNQPEASLDAPLKSLSGGEIDCVDKDGNTPLHVAARYGHELLINTLITSGADTAK